MDTVGFIELCAFWFILPWTAFNLELFTNHGKNISVQRNYGFWLRINSVKKVLSLRDVIFILFSHLDVFIILIFKRYAGSLLKMYLKKELAPGNHHQMTGFPDCGKLMQCKRCSWRREGWSVCRGRNPLLVAEVVGRKK